MVMKERKVLRASVGEVGADADGGESSSPAGSVRGDRGGAKPPTDLTHLLLDW